MKQKTHKLNYKAKLSPTYQLAAAMALFMAATLASRGAGMHPWEVSLFESIYNWPDWLHPVFFVVTQLGSIHALGLLLIIYLLARRYSVVVELLLTSLLTYLAAGFAKDIWGRLRPNELLPGIVNLDYVVRGPGYPSGHMALATAMALVIGHHLPRKYHWLLVVVVSGIGLSRLYLGVHAPLDIVGGFAIGWVMYALVRHVRIYDRIATRSSKASKAS